ncbi:MAG: hypothetical protein AB7W44_06895 [Pyrinomonadaceae bacterium]
MPREHHALILLERLLAHGAMWCHVVPRDFFSLGAGQVFYNELFAAFGAKVPRDSLFKGNRKRSEQKQS